MGPSTVKMNGACAPPLTAPPGFALRSARQASAAVLARLVLCWAFFLSVSPQREAGPGAIYLPPLNGNGQAFCSFPHSQKSRPFSCQAKRGHKAPPPFAPPGAPAGITHYTLQARSCAKGGCRPLWNPPVLRSWSRRPRPQNTNSRVLSAIFPADKTRLFVLRTAEGASVLFSENGLTQSSIMLSPHYAV